MLHGRAIKKGDEGKFTSRLGLDLEFVVASFGFKITVLKKWMLHGLPIKMGDEGKFTSRSGLDLEFKITTLKKKDATWACHQKG